MVSVELFEKFIDNHDRQIDLLVKVIQQQGTRISNLEQKLGQNSDLERAVLAEKLDKLKRERIYDGRIQNLFRSPPPNGWVHPNKMPPIITQ